MSDIAKDIPREPTSIPVDNLDLRDYFAAKAMQAMIPVDDCDGRTLAKEAYEMADAMLQVREEI